MNDWSSGKGFGVNYLFVWFKSRRSDFGNFLAFNKWLKSIICQVALPSTNELSNSKRSRMCDQLFWFKSRGRSFQMIWLKLNNKKWLKLMI